MSSDSDAILARQAMEGGRAAFEALVRRHEKAVFAFARPRAASLADAEEISQEAFLRAWRDLPRLSRPEAFASWLYGIAINVSREYRREAGRNARAARAVEPAAPGEAPEGEPGEEGAILLAVDALPDEYRVPLTLHAGEGLPYAEIAERLGIAESSARSRVCRAKRMIRRRLAGA